MKKCFSSPLQLLTGYVLFPLAYVMGPSEVHSVHSFNETLRVAELMGIKTIVNEFVAYQRLGCYVHHGLISVKRELEKENSIQFPEACTNDRHIRSVWLFEHRLNRHPAGHYVGHVPASERYLRTCRRARSVGRIFCLLHHRMCGRYVKSKRCFIV